MTMLADSLRDYYLQHYVGDALKVVQSQPEALTGLSRLSIAGLVSLLERVDATLLVEIFSKLTVEKQLEVLTQASNRTTLILLHSLSETERDQFLLQLPATPRQQMLSLLAFTEQAAGYYMEREQIQFKGSDTVSDALNKLRQSKRMRARSVYVVDGNNTLLGRVDLQDMALADKSTVLSSLLHPVEGFANLTSPREDLIAIFETHRVDSIPILDLESRLIGVVRYASLFHAVEEERSADMQKMVGVSVEERALSAASFAVKKRLPWLHINLLTAFLAAAVVGLFENIIAQFTALAILLPVVAGQSGNAGSQALAVTMRGLALKEISILKWRTVLAKEFKVGVIEGVALGFTCGLGVYVWSQSLGLAIVIGIAMITSMIAAGISGAVVPMLLIRIGQDPATASSIILTTVTDVAGFLSFLGTATLLSFML